MFAVGATRPDTPAGAGPGCSAPARTWFRSGESLRLEGVELLLGDGAGVEQALGVGDLLRRAGRAGRNLLDVLLLLDLRVGDGLHLTLAHAAATRDEVDQRTEPRDEDQHDGPAGLAPTAQRAVAEHVEDAAEPDHDLAEAVDVVDAHRVSHLSGGGVVVMVEPVVLAAQEAHRRVAAAHPRASGSMQTLTARISTSFCSGATSTLVSRTRNHFVETSATLVPSSASVALGPLA